MKKSIFLICLASTVSVQANNTLFDKVKNSFIKGGYPKLEDFSQIGSNVTSGRCIFSNLPNGVIAAYFALSKNNGDQFVLYKGDLITKSNVPVDYYDNIQYDSSGIPDNKVRKVRFPLIDQDDGKTVQFENEKRNQFSIRGSKDMLLAKIEVFESDLELFCYFSKLNDSRERIFVDHTITSIKGYDDHQ